ncbi:hypothetical protein PIIN_00233 [Serendipita indica DSM 11827]|uniref:F-box domain-containing protein n=1 Tax=Serendipita indica (strain DSM 11827) TaxID=1109443 RepID=G4T5F1_SERID|nr:hypothetical protein PIIN_00233 [Serendipita indica DSM 11827]
MQRSRRQIRVINYAEEPSPYNSESESSELTELSSNSSSLEMYQNHSTFLLARVTHRILSAAEREGAIVHIQTNSLEVDACQKEEDKLSKIIGRLDVQISRLKDQIQAERLKVFQALFVPREQLKIMFEYFVIELGQSPWILTQVCRWWRHVALTTGKLWSRILVNLAPSSSHPCRRQDEREVCRNIKEFRRALARSAGANFDLEFIIHPKWPVHRDSKFEVQVSDAVQEAAALLISSGAIRRLVNVTLGEVDIDFRLNPSCRIREPYGPIIDAVIQMAPALRAADICGDSDMFRRVIQPPKRLRKLQYFRLQSLTSSLSCANLCGLLAGLTHLRELELANVSIATSGLPVVKLSFLQKLTLRTSHVYRGLLRLPSLEHLVLQRSKYVHIKPLNITKLELDDITYDSEQFSDIKCASLQSLSLASRGFDNQPHEPSISNLTSCQANLFSISISLFITTPTLLNILKSCSALSELHIQRTPLDKEFFVAIAGGELPRVVKIRKIEKDRFLCPTLKVITIDCSMLTLIHHGHGGYSTWQDIKIEGWAQRAFKRRRLCLYPLDASRLKLAKRQGTSWLEL